MNILFAFREASNPYVEVLAGGIRALGEAATLGLDLFWQADPLPFDVVHIQWPESLFDWRVPGKAQINLLRNRLRQLRCRLPLVFTRHNRQSHVVNKDNRPILSELYQLVETECDAIVHLGAASLQECARRQELSPKRHEIIPIPIYEERFAPYLSLDRREACRRLGLPRNRPILLAFGKFRFEEERQLARQAQAVWEGAPRPVLLAAKWYRARDYSFTLRHPLLSWRSLRKALWARRRGLWLGAKKLLTDEEVALQFAAADLVLIPRVDELNSGNVPMAFLFRKVAVGPEGGNIGSWLQATGNPVFRAGDGESLRTALRRAQELIAAGHGQANYRFAMAHWTTRQIAAAHLRLYHELKALPRAGGPAAWPDVSLPD